MDQVGSSPAVVVIGAGISGLVAADLLVRRCPGLGVVVVEADSRVGGRIIGVELSQAGGEVVDLGGEWMTLDQPHVLDLADRFDLRKSAPSPGDRPVPADDLLLLPPVIVNPRSGSKHHELQSGGDSIEGGPDRQSWTPLPWRPPWTPAGVDLGLVSVDHYFKDQEEVLDQAGVRLRTICGVDPDSVSMWFLLNLARSRSGGSLSAFLTESGLKSFRIPGGIHQVVARLYGDLSRASDGGPPSVQFRLNSQVVSVVATSDERGSVEVRLESGESIECSRIICTAPPISVAAIRFEATSGSWPCTPPPSYLKGRSIKFVVAYREKYWANVSGTSGTVVNFRPDEVNPLVLVCDGTSEHPGAVPRLIAFAGGNSSRIFDNLDPEEVKDKVLQCLSQVFLNPKEVLGPHWALDPVDFAYKDWSKDRPWGCSMGVPPVGCFPSIPQPVVLGRIHFSGAETATMHYGSIEGAVSSGRKAALEVLMDLAPQNLTEADQLELAEATHAAWSRGPGHAWAVNCSSNWHLPKVTLMAAGLLAIFCIWSARKLMT